MLIILYYLRSVDTYVGSPCRNSETPLFLTLSHTNIEQTSAYTYLHLWSKMNVYTMRMMNVQKVLIGGNNLRFVSLVEVC